MSYATFLTALAFKPDGTPLYLDFKIYAFNQEKKQFQYYMEVKPIEPSRTTKQVNREATTGI